MISGSRISSSFHSISFQDDSDYLSMIDKYSHYFFKITTMTRMDIFKERVRYGRELIQSIDKQRVETGSFHGHGWEKAYALL